MGWGGVGAVASRKGGELVETKGALFAQELGVSWEERFTSSIVDRR